MQNILFWKKAPDIWSTSNKTQAPCIRGLHVKGCLITSARYRAGKVPQLQLLWLIITQDGNCTGEKRLLLLTLLGDLTVSAQQDVFHRGVKHEPHILQEALEDRQTAVLIQRFKALRIFKITHDGKKTNNQLHWRITLQLQMHLTHFYTQGVIWCLNLDSVPHRKTTGVHTSQPLWQLQSPENMVGIKWTLVAELGIW